MTNIYIWGLKMGRLPWDWYRREIRIATDKRQTFHRPMMIGRQKLTLTWLNGVDQHLHSRTIKRWGDVKSSEWERRVASSHQTNLPVIDDDNWLVTAARIWSFAILILENDQLSLTRIRTTTMMMMVNGGNWSWQRGQSIAAQMIENDGAEFWLVIRN